MTIHVAPEVALQLLNALNELLDSYHLSDGDKLVEDIRPYWQGGKAEEFKRKSIALQEQLSTNLRKAKEFHAQARAKVLKLIELDGQ